MPTLAAGIDADDLVVSLITPGRLAQYNLADAGKPRS
jgi:hypothetical protein